MNIVQKVYYSFKPLVPRKLQIILRRHRTSLKKRQVGHVWPIFEQAGTPPQGWPGWPDNKKFALLLTHDVDSMQGHQKCLDLLSLEKELGFRSSFFFVPESYPVSSAVLEKIKSRGGEVGVHGLYHDGKLYHSRHVFKKRAVRINQYLAAWGAQGFRSPCMHHKLEWIHDLRIDYDASTYDTDPFEPQGGGVQTIFPFIVRDPLTGHTYIEIPYTLPQDHLLYVIMNEKNIDIWKKKLDWIVEKGGMAHVITHPDYMKLKNPDNRLGNEEYHGEMYSEFLEYIKTQYKDLYWNPLAKDMARFCSQALQTTTAPQQQTARDGVAHLPAADESSATNVCMIVYSFYPIDPRVRREAEALIDQGLSVDILCIKRESSEKDFEIINGVNVYRLPLVRQYKGKLNYLWEYFYFICATFIKAAFLNHNRRYKIVHIHNMPDILVISSLIPKISGAKIILDLHDPMPEVYMTKYSLPETHVIIRLLVLIEKLCIKYADLVLTPNISFRDLFVVRGCPPRKIHIVMNSPQEKVFFHNGPAPARQDNTFTIMFHGTITERHGLDTALEALRHLRKTIPAISFVVFGEGDFVDQFIALSQKYSLHDIVHFKGLVSLEEIVSEIKRADVGLIPNKLSPFTNINFPTRIFEYLCLNKPVIVPRTQGILDYFHDDDIFFFEPGNAANLAEIISFIFRHKEACNEKVQHGSLVYKRYTWEKESRQFKKLVSDLLVS